MARHRPQILGVALVAAFVAPVAAPSVPDAPQSSARSVAIDDWREPARSMAATGDAPAWVESAPIDAGDAVVVGADWGGVDLDAEVRFRDGDGWSDWNALEISDEHLPDGEEAAGIDRDVSEPIWVGRVEELQFRADRRPRTFEAELVDIAGDLDHDPDAVPANSAVADTRPAIRSRASWGADESLRDRRVSVADGLRFAVIHHVQEGSIWTKADIANGCRSAASKINGIYRYHTVGRGYWDIAYNFIVDPCGGVWEGRAGGVERPVMGAHAAGFNSGSTGILALGAYDASASSPADPVTAGLVSGIERLAGWKLGIHGVDPDSSTREVSGCSSCSSRYPAGRAVTLPVLSAHQVQNSTSCPGSGVMRELFVGRGSNAWPTRGFVDAVSAIADATEPLGPRVLDAPPPLWRGQTAADRPTWDVRFTEPVDWSLRITDADGALVRATGGQNERTAERTWDLRDADGAMVRAGTYTARLSGAGASGPLPASTTEVHVTPGVSRRQGSDRTATAAALSRWAFPSANTVVLASAGAYADALVASPLAGSYGAPVLLTHPDGLSSAAAAEIRRLGADRVLVTGGPAAVSPTVVTALESMGLDVDRLSGPDRFATAAVVAERVWQRRGHDEVLLALGAHADSSRAFPDALAAGAFGAEADVPVLLAAPDTVPPALAAALRALEPARIQIFGGTVAVSEATERAIRDIAPGTTLARFAGADRFDTARLAADELQRRRVAAKGPAAATADLQVVVASGLNWPDALGAGAAAKATGASFLLVPRDTLDAASRGFLDAHRSRIAGIEVAGGSAAIGGRVVDAVARYVGAAPGTARIAWASDPNRG